MSTFSERRKSLGQSFLEDRNILALEAKLADPAGKTVLEIGPGDGRLTDAVLTLNPKKIIAVEKDPRFAEALRKKYSGSKVVEIVEGDILEFEPAGHLPDGAAKGHLPDGTGIDVVVGNIPYYISSDIVFKLAPMDFGKAVLMVQKEFAQKMAAAPGDRNYGRLSVTAQLAFDVRLERTVLRHLFRPMPEVDSAIVVLKPTGRKLTQFQENVIRYIFQHKNKTVRNALLDSKAFSDEEFAPLGAFAKRKGRTLSKEECLEIARLLGG